MKRMSHLFFALLLVPWFAFAQKPSERDVQLFKAYFYDSVSYAVDLRTFVRVYNKLERAEQTVIQKRLRGKSYNRLTLGEPLSLYHFATLNFFHGVTGMPIYTDMSVIEDLDDIYCANGQKERPVVYPLTLKFSQDELLGLQFDHQHVKDSLLFVEQKDVRKRMKHYIRQFRSQASTLPLFYQIIDNAYSGDVDAYVDDLLDHSIFANNRNLKDYEYHSLSSYRLRIDPLVIYSVCRAQYVGQTTQHSDNAPATNRNIHGMPAKLSDKQLFVNYFLDSIRTRADWVGVNHLYFIKEKSDKDEIERVKNMEDWDFHIAPQTWWPYDLTSQRTSEHHELSQRSYYRVLQDMYDRMHIGYNEVEDKARMKRLIKDFRTTATKLPTFYQCIDKKFKGNVDTYVDYIFDNSLFLNKERFEKMEKILKKRDLASDPLVKYTLSVMQYLYCD